jgi:hypothetical protein
MFGLNYNGLKQRKTYNELVDYLESGQEKIKYPDRFAKFLRESLQLSNLLDGEGIDYEAVIDQQKNAMKYQEIETNIRRRATENDETHAHVRATTRQSRTPSDVSMFDWGSAYEEVQQDIEMEQQAMDEQSRTKQQQFYENVQDDLGATSSSFAQRMASASAASSSNQPRDDVEQTAIVPIEVDPEEKKRAMDDKPRDDAKPKKVKDTPPINITGEMIRKIADVDLALKAIKESQRIPAQMKAKDDVKTLMLGNTSGDTGGTGGDSPSRRIRVKQSIGKDKGDDSPSRSSASREHGTKRDTNMNPKYWKDEVNPAYIMDQLENHYKYKFTPEQKKGVYNKGKLVAGTKITKPDLLRFIYHELGIETKVKK